MNTMESQSMTYPFSLTALPFDYDALEPYIDAQTMQIHHAQHHQSYITHLNEALKDQPSLHNFTVEELLKRVDKLPIAIRQTVHDQGGGHYHHQLFWSLLQPASQNSSPNSALQEAINRDFGSLDAFKEKFVAVGTKHFASGWVFLALNPASGSLEVFSRPDHNNVLAEKKQVLLINDVWEHAYYLKHQSNRPGYLKAFWDVVNWEQVNQLYEKAMSSKDRLSGLKRSV